MAEDPRSQDPRTRQALDNVAKRSSAEVLSREASRQHEIPEIRAPATVAELIASPCGRDEELLAEASRLIDAAEQE